MRKFVVFTVMVLLIVVGVHAQDKINFMKVTDQLLTQESLPVKYPGSWLTNQTYLQRNSLTEQS